MTEGSIPEGSPTSTPAVWVAGVATALVGGLVLGAWGLGFRGFVAFLPGTVPMMPLTAVGFVVLGLALVAAGPSRAGRLMAGGLALMLAALGILTLSVAALGPWLDLDLLLFPEYTATLGLITRGWPGPNSGMLFLLSAWVLLRSLRPGDHSPVLSQVIALSVGLVALLALVGYLYGVVILYEVPTTTAMAFSTALGFLVGAFGLVLLHPREGVMAVVTGVTPGGVLARWIAPGLVVIPILLGGLVLWGERSGLYDSTFGISVLVVGTIVVFGTLSWTGARRLHGLDVQRVDAERSLRESESRFRALAENAAEAIVTIDADDRIVFANPATQRIFGYDAATLTAMPFSDLIPPRFRDAHRAGMERYLATSKRNIPWDGIELPGLRADGREVPLEVTFSEYERGEQRFFTGIMRDIQARIEAEENRQFLLEASRLLASSLELTPTLKQVGQLAVPRLGDWCIIDLVEDGRISRVTAYHQDPAKSAAAQELTKRFPPSLDEDLGAGRVIREGRPQLMAEITPEAILETSRGDEHHRLLEAMGLRSAMIVPMIGHDAVRGAITLLSAESGREFDEADLDFAAQLGAIAGIAVDNAHLHQSIRSAQAEAERRAREEAALREAAGALSATFTTDEVVEQIAGNALESTDADGAFVQRLDPTGRMRVVAAAGELSSSVEPGLAYEATHDAGTEFRTTVVPRLGDGGPLVPPSLAEAHPDHSALVVPLRDESRLIGALLLVRDADKASFEEDEIHRATTFADLAALAFVKVQLLEESERRREELERVSESRARLMRGFSHDVRNPLGAAEGFAELLLTGVLGDLDDRQTESIERMRGSIRSALRLIEDLMELARTEAGRIEVRAAPTDLLQVAREIVEDYRAQAEAKGLTIGMDVAAGIPDIETDPERVRQVLGNLVSNAVKYTDQGSVSVSVSCPAAESGGRWAIEARVSDTGPGIPDDRLGLLFQEFSRLEPERGSGAGVGLSIARQVARAIGGDIEVESHPGQGTSFSLLLPHRVPEVAQIADA